MDEQRLHEWQKLHHRYVNEEPMSETEMATYQAGCDEFDAEEMEILSRTGNEQMRMLEQQLAEANAERQHLQDREQQQIARIAELEDRLGLFRFQIEEIIYLRRGYPTLLIGRLLNGVIKYGDYIAVPLKDGSVVRGFVMDLEANHKKVSRVSAAECENGIGVAVTQIEGFAVALGIVKKWDKENHE